MSPLAKFLSKRARELSMERQGVLRTVRESLKGKKPFYGSGSDDDILDAGQNIVRGLELEDVHPYNLSQNARKKGIKELRRRGFLESILADKDLAPKSFLVETRNKKYVVQPKEDLNLNSPSMHNQFRSGDVIEKYYDNLNLDKSAPFYEKKKYIGDYLDDLVGEQGIDTYPSSSRIGFFDNTPKITDMDGSYLKRPMTTSERKSALEKFISYGKRRKPWLDE